MSYILDALRKSEYERRMRETPTLSPFPSVPQHNSSRPGWLWPVIILMSLNVAALLFWFNHTNNTPQRPKQQPLELKPVPITRIPEQKPYQAIVNMPTPLINNKKTNPVKKTEVQTHSIADLVTSVTPPSKPKQPLVKSHSKTHNTAVIQPKLPTVKPILIKKSKKINELGKHTTQYRIEKQNNIIPYLHTLSQNFQNQIPPIKVSVHMYSRDAKDSFAIINMTKYHTGEILSEGLKLEKITSKGLVLSFGDKNFQIGQP